MGAPPPLEYYLGSSLLAFLSFLSTILLSLFLSLVHHFPPLFIDSLIMSNYKVADISLAAFGRKEIGLAEVC